MSVVVTRGGGGTTTVKYQLSSWAAKPFIYTQLAAQIALNWTLPSGATMAASLVGRDGTVQGLGSAPGTYTKQVGTASKYAGDWAIDNSGGYTPPGASHDTGVDQIASGISAATMADPSRSIADELLPTCTAQYIQFVITWNASVGTATINYPVFYAPTTPSKLIWLSGQCMAMIYANGPGVRYGSELFYDPISGFTVPPEVKGLGFKSSVIDYIAWRDAVLQGVPPTSASINTELSTVWFDSTEYTSIGDAAGVTMGVPLPKTSDNAFRAAIISGYQEVPPLAIFPVGARDPVTWLPTGVDAQEAWDFAVEARNFVQAGSNAQLYPPSGPTWSQPLTGYGQWKLSYHKHPVTNAEDDTFLIKDPNGTYALNTPWHGVFMAGLPSGGESPYDLETVKGQHHLVYLISGNIHYRWSPFTGAQWAYDTPVTDGLAFAGGWTRARIDMDLRDGQIWLTAGHVNQGGGDPLATGVYLMWTADDGQTFGPISGGNLAPYLLMASSVQSDIKADDDGGLLAVYSVPDSGSTGPGQFKALYKGPGDQTWGALTAVTLVDTTNTPLHHDGSGFGFSYAHEEGGRFRLVMVVYGETDISVWYSGDTPKGKTWTRES